MTTTIIAKMQALAVGGESIGVIEEAENGDWKGRKVFISGTIPTELVEARVLEDHKNYFRAELISIKAPSSSRIVPPCPWYSTCGGCDLQHTELKTQRSEKLRMVQTMLEKQAQVTSKRGINLIGEDLPGFHYRGRVGLHLSSNGALGFFKRGSGEVVAIDSCMISRPEINQAIQNLAPALARFSRIVGGVIIELVEETIHVVLKLREDIKAPSSAQLELVVKEISAIFPRVVVTRSGKTLKSPSPEESRAGHFSQVNAQANEILVRQVVSSIRSARVHDLYAGSGNFSLPLARAGKKVIAVELDPILVRLGRAQAAREHLTSDLKFVESGCEKYLQSEELSPALVLDPPRSGVKEIATKITPDKINEIVYVSCNLPSLTRDLKVLCSQGFELEEVKVLDMFAQTQHVECLAFIKAR